MEKVCFYSGLGFDNCEDFYQHLDEKNGLAPPKYPVPDRRVAVASAVHGTLRVYTVPGSKESDFLQFIMDINRKSIAWYRRL